MHWRAIYPWFLGEMALYVVLHMVLLTAVWRFGHAPLPLEPLYLVLLTLAVYRGAHILSNEKITKPIRAPFIRTRENEEGKEVEQPVNEGLRGAIGTLICCPSCTGIWVATVLVYGYLLAPFPATILIIILALSAGERLVTMVYDHLKAPVNLAPPRS